ncbi:MAG: WD40 repeat domain-containing protein [Caldilineaceae bacterium]
MLTSREQPDALARLLLGRGRQAQEMGRIRVFALPGLNHQAACQLLVSNGLNIDQQGVTQLVENYSGNPLALQIVAGAIADFFGGDITAFQQEAEGIFDGIRLVLDQQFTRLSALERDILVWLAIEREAITVPTLRNNLLSPIGMGQLLEALHSLQNRSFLEPRGAGLTLQNVIIEYTTEYLVEQVCQEIAADLLTKWQETHNESRGVAPTHPIIHSFLNRFALIQAHAKTYVRQSQARLILQPLIERLMTRMDKTQLAAVIQQLLDTLRATDVKTGYAAGNLLNLVLALQFDGSGFDFSALHLRQAFLQGMTLNNVNFRDADLTHAVFTNRFGLINSVAINPTQTLIAAGTGTGEIRIWHYANRQLAVSIPGQQKPVWAVLFSPDGQLLASSDDQTVQLWQIEVSGEQVMLNNRRTLVGHTSDVHALAFDPTGKTMASAGYDQSICVWDLESGTLLQRFTGHSGYIYSIAFHPDGGLLASGSDDQTVRLWDLQCQTCRILRGHTGRVYGVAFGPAGKLLATCSTDHTVRLWNVAGGELCQTLHGHADVVHTVAFHPSGELIASGGYDETIRIWSIQKSAAAGVRGEINQILRGHTAWLRSVAFAPDGNTLISGSIDYTVRIWGLQGENGQAHHILQGHTTLIRAVAVSPDGTTLVSGSSDHALRIWDMREPGAVQVSQTLMGHTRLIRTVAFHPGGELIASGGFDKSIRLWVKNGGAWQLQRTLTGHTDLVRVVTFSPDGTVLVSAGSDQTIRVWEVTTGRHLYTLDEQSGTVWSVAFHPDGATLASGSADHTIRLWDLRNYAEPRAFMPAGKRMRTRSKPLPSAPMAKCSPAAVTTKRSACGRSTSLVKPMDSDRSSPGTRALSGLSPLAPMGRCSPVAAPIKQSACGTCANLPTVNAIKDWRDIRRGFGWSPLVPTGRQ